MLFKVAEQVVDRLLGDLELVGKQGTRHHPPTRKCDPRVVTELAFQGPYGLTVKYVARPI
jgi:hypothetical protein